MVREWTALSRSEEKLVELTNGCICCTLRDDLLLEVRRLAAEQRFDYLLIESTGVSEPLPVAATFEFRDENGESLADVARLDTLVTVVDAIHLLKDYGSTDFLKDRGESAGEEDERTLVNLLVEQIEFADVVVLNKVSDATPEQRSAIRAIVHALNPDARLIETDHGRVSPAAILDTGLFDFERAHQHPLWFKELYGFADHVPEDAEYGITSFVWRARRPFVPERFAEFLETPLPGAFAPRAISGWRRGRTGSASSASPAPLPLPGRWASGGRPCRARWPAEGEARARMMRQMDPVFGDRRQELVFIGTLGTMNRARISAMLNRCLVEGTACEPAVWARLPDPFPAWGAHPTA